MTTLNLQDDLSRSARFGANISDSHGCYIFLPLSVMVASDNEGSSSHETLVLGGHHSLSRDVIRECQIYVGSGLVGWVAKHKRSIHVSPFERDSRTLGFYSVDQQLKSFIGIPVFLDHLDSPAANVAGVIACDSKKSFAFSKIQGKLLEDLSCEVSNCLRLSHLVLKNGIHKQSWQRFLTRAQKLSESLGKDSLEILRLKIRNQTELESSLGCSACIALFEQVLRLIEQSLPPHFPCYRTPTGDLIMVVDNMMTSFLENKILAICSHCSVSHPAALGRKNVSFDVHFMKRSNRLKQYRRASLEELINASARAESEKDHEVLRSEDFGKGLELVYEYKRA